MSSEEPDDRHRDVRRCALQALYQLDSGGHEAADLIGSFGPEGERRAADDARTQGTSLALKAWSCRADADAAVAQLAPEWPTHRQPVVDRNVLRLAWYEMRHTKVPAAVAINEAVELAKEFGTEKSGPFVNAVLDKIHKSDAIGPGESADAGDALRKGEAHQDREGA